MAFKLKLNNSSGVPYYKQIVDSITYGVINNILKPGEKLPTVRQLAVDLQVNLNTIVKAYTELEIKGIVNTQQGTGTFISDTKPEISSEEQEQKLRNLCTHFISELSSYGILLADAVEMLKSIEADQHTGETKKTKGSKNA